MSFFSRAAVASNINLQIPDNDKRYQNDKHYLIRCNMFRAEFSIRSALVAPELDAASRVSATDDARPSELIDLRQHVERIGAPRRPPR